MMEIKIRDARVDEVVMLGDLALRSKAYWGYDKDFLESVRAELTFHADDVRTRRLVVAEHAGRVVGFAGLEAEPPEGELAQRIGTEPSSSISGRELPLLRFHTRRRSP